MYYISYDSVLRKLSKTSERVITISIKSRSFVVAKDRKYNISCHRALSVSKCGTRFGGFDHFIIVSQRLKKNDMLVKKEEVVRSYTDLLH